MKAKVITAAVVVAAGGGAFLMSGSSVIAPLMAVVELSKAHMADGEYTRLALSDGVDLPNTLERKYTVGGVNYRLAIWPDSLGLLITRPTHYLNVKTVGSTEVEDQWLGRTPRHALEIGSTNKWALLNAATLDTIYAGTIDTWAGGLCIINQVGAGGYDGRVEQ